MTLGLNAIHRALGTQLRANLARDTDTNPFPIGIDTYPSITIYPDPSGYLVYHDTMGASGYTQINLRLKLAVEGDDESVFIKISDYLSAGAAFTSSIHDAVMADHTLGGTVSECVVLEAEWDAENDPSVAWIPVRILTTKLNART